MIQINFDAGFPKSHCADVMTYVERCICRVSAKMKGIKLRSLLETERAR